MCLILPVAVYSCMQIYKEETFGPAVPLFKFKHDEEAITLANDTIYGLAAYFYTKVKHNLCADPVTKICNLSAMCAFQAVRSSLPILPDSKHNRIAFVMLVLCSLTVSVPVYFTGRSNCAPCNSALR